MTMSSTDTHETVHNDLARRRELARLTKPELITHAIRLERLLGTQGEQ